jgi:urease accessory protein
MSQPVETGKETMMGRQVLLRMMCGLAVSAAMVGPSAAHHPMGGQAPTTFVEGLLSGLGHPVIGPDHLAFIIAVGIAAAMIPAGMALVGAFIAASTAGVLVHLAAVDLPLAEALVAGSVVAAGALLAFGRLANNGVWLTLAVLAGLVHGYAFGEAVVGSDRSVVGAYLVGLAVVSAAIATGVMSLTRAFILPQTSMQGYLTAAGVAVAAVGITMLANGRIG